MATNQSDSSSERLSGPGGPSAVTEPVGRTPALWLELEVRLPDTLDCLLATCDVSGSGQIQLVGTQCHLTLERDDGDGESGEVYTARQDICDNCVGLRFSQPGCTPEFLLVRDDVVVFCAYLDDRDVLEDVVADVRSVAQEVRLRRLTRATEDVRPGGGSAPGRVEALSLTDKQREAVEFAIEMGYYETPRRASLGDMADRLGVSRSALSQRLNAVEQKLVTELAADL